MANFDWDKFDDADEQAQGFDWDAHADADQSQALETGLDFLTGASQGATLGAADELAGLLSAGVETGLGKLGIGPSAVDEQLAAQGFDIPQESFLEKYRGYQEAGEQEAQAARERSPVAEFAGQIGGGLLSSSLAGLNAATLGPKALLSEVAKNQGKSKAALDLLRGTATSGSRLTDAAARGVGMFGQASPFLAAESALVSEKDIIGPESDIPGVAGDVASGLAFGLPAMVGLNVAADLPGAAKERVGKRVEQVAERVKKEFADEDNPRLRQMAKSFTEYGQKLGIHPRSHAQDIGGLKFSQRDSNAAKTVLDVLNTADDKFGQELGDSIQKAEARGALIDISPDIQAAAQRISDLSAQLPDLGATRKSAMAFDKILNGMPQLTPVEVKNLIDDLDAAIGTFKSATQKGAADVGTLNELMRYRRAVSDTFKKAVPEYAEAAQQFESFRNVLEQVVSGHRRADVTQIFYGSLRNQDQKVSDKILDMIQNVQKTGQSAGQYRTAFTNFMDALEKFENQQLVKGAPSALPSSNSLRQFILDASDDSVLRGSVRQTTESRSIVPDLKEAFLGKAPTSGAFLAGKATKTIGDIAAKPSVKKLSAISKGIYRAPAQSIANLASKLETTGEFKAVGRALREAVENGDTAKKNAALFTIMQNPNSRAFIGAEDFPDVEKEEE
jgi:cell fate (sporulation/competence/biofilm development) regulator YlbF (YheA/YmcA/DUF963 family)